MKYLPKSVNHDQTKSWLQRQLSAKRWAALFLNLFRESNFNKDG